LNTKPNEPAVTFDNLLESLLRKVVREEIAAAVNGSGRAPSLVEVGEDEQRLSLLASAKAAVDAGALLTAEQLAVMLQVNKATIYERVKKKRIPFYQVGRFVRFNLQEVLESEKKRLNETP